MYQPLTAGDLCTRDTVFAFPHLALNEAARLMREQHVGSLVVVDETDRGRVVTGMLTDRDLVTAVIAKDMDPRQFRVGDVMSNDLVTVRETDSVMDALAAMRRKGVRRVPVTDAHGMLVGVLAIDDMLGMLAEQMRALVAAIETERVQEKSARP